MNNYKPSPEQLNELLYSKFIGAKFMFFTEDGLGLINRVVVILESIRSSNGDKIVLEGVVVFKSDAKAGKVHIKNGIAKIIRNHSHYILESDNRTKSLWDEFLNLLNKAK